MTPKTLASLAHADGGNLHPTNFSSSSVSVCVQTLDPTDNVSLSLHLLSTTPFQMHDRVT